MGASQDKLSNYYQKKSLFIIVSCEKNKIGDFIIKEYKSENTNNFPILEKHCSIYYKTTERKENKKNEYIIQILLFPIKVQSEKNVQLIVEQQSKMISFKSSSLLFDSTKNNFFFQTFFEIQGSQDKEMPDQYKMTISEELILFLELFDKYPNDNLFVDLWKDCLKQIHSDTKEFNFPFALELFVSYYPKFPNFMKELFQLLDLKKQIEPPIIYKDKYLTLIRQTYPQFKSENYYIKFIFFFFYSFPEYFDEFFSLIQNDSQGPLLIQIINHKQAFSSLKQKYLCKLTKNLKNSKVFYRIFDFPLSASKYLELLLDDIVIENLNKWKEPSPKHIKLDELYKPNANENIQEILELYKKVKQNPSLKEHFIIDIDISKYFEFSINNNLNILLYLHSYIKENELNDLEEELDKGIEETFSYLAKNKSFADVNLDKLMNYFKCKNTFFSEFLSLQNKNSEVITYLLKDFFSKVTNISELIKLYPLLNDKTIKKELNNEYKSTLLVLLLKGIDENEINTLLVDALMIMKNNKISFNEKITDEIEDKVDTKKVISYYNCFISNTNISSIFESFIEKITVFLISKVPENAIEESNVSEIDENRIIAEALYEIKKIFPQKHIKIFLDKIKENFELQEKDILSKKDTISYILWTYFMKDNTMTENKKHNYFYTSSSNMKKVYKKLNEKTFKIGYIKELNEIKDKLKNRLEVVLSGTEEDKNKLTTFYEGIKTIIEDFLRYEKHLNIVIRYINIFENSNEALNKKYKELSNNLITLEIKSLLNKKQDFEELQKYQTSYLQTLRYTEASSYFMIFYNYYTQKLGMDSDKAKTKAIQNIDNLKLIFEVTESSELNPTLVELFNILNTMRKEDKKLSEIQKELKNLYSFHKISKQISEDDFTSIGKKISIFLNVKDIQKHVLARLALINNTGVKKTIDGSFHILNELAKIINDGSYKNKFVDLYDNVTKLQIDLFSTDNVNNFWSVIGEDHKIFEFLADKTLETARTLYALIDDAQDESNKTNLTLVHVEALIAIVNFFIDIKSEATDLNDITIFETINKKLSDDANKKIVTNFGIVISSLPSFREIFKSKIDKNQFTKERIKQLSKESTFKIKTNPKTNQYECTVYYKNGNNEDKQEDFSSILELRDRSLLKKRDLNKLPGEKGTKEYEEKVEQNIKFMAMFEQFDKFVSDIKLLIETLNEFIEKGIPFEYEFEATLPSGNAIQTTIDRDQQVNEKIGEIVSTLKTTLTDYEQKTMKKYQSPESQVLTFIYGRRFSILNDLMIQNNKAKPTHFLKFLTGGLDPKLPDFTFHGETTVIDALQNNASNFINTLYNINNLSLSKIYAKNLIQNKKSSDEKVINSGMYSLLINESRVEIELIECYLNITGHIPLPQTVLQCNETTSPEEICAFYYRAVYCEEPVLFTIFKTEFLNVKARQKLVSLLAQQASTDATKMKSSLLILFWDKIKDIIVQISQIKEVKKLSFVKHITYTDDGFDLTYFRTIRVTTSELAAGVGKSTFIRTQSVSIGREYIYFPVGGEFTKEDLVNRLLQLKIESGKEEETDIHIDLFGTKQMNLMKEFLFELLILRTIIVNEKVFYLHPDVCINIELPYGFVQFYDIFTILQLFERATTSKTKLPRIQVSEEVPLSNIQIVTNFLRYLQEDKINDNDIIIETRKFNNNPKSKILGIVPFQNDESDECESLLREFFTYISNPTYYQFTIFTNILADQFQKFSNNPFLKVASLQSIGKQLKKKNLNKMRSTIIRNFISLTKYFTKGAYDDLITQQKSTYNFFTGGNYNEEEIEKKEAEALVKPALAITFDNIEDSIVFINEDKQSLTIIPGKNTSPEEKQDLTSLLEAYHTFMNPNSLLQQQRLTDFGNLKKEEYLGELQKIYGLSSTIDHLLNQTKEYEITRDNFIKMILILMRTRCRIPVILMGETGCGKTALLRTLATLKGYPMYVLNIHAGIIDQEIIDFMEKHDLVSKGEEITNPNVQKWVFFDEVNTCNSMGLITEMMTKYTMLGRKLRDDVVIIAACNPYKKIDANVTGLDVGLVKKKEHLVRNLVYNVNPLPHSLLSFILNFGSLQPEDEKKYIKCIIDTILDRKFVDDKDQFKTLISELIFECQNYIREKYGAFTVSLRDVRRFVILFEWFYNYLQQKVNEKRVVELNNKKFDYSQIDKKQCAKDAVFLCLYMCYFIRIQVKEQRVELNAKITKMAGSKFLDVIEREQEDLINQVEIPIGIAKNKALLDNMFALFVCVCTKIPLFICGKPGCSKSLSANLLYAAMNGEFSKNSFFKKYPRIIRITFQGSETSTSAGVLKVFEKAKDVLRSRKEKGEKLDDIRSMIFFDEMGLAEISKFNPLKVIHSELDFDPDRPETEQVAFVGISNWKLDAAKMNRGIFLSIPEPDQDDLIYTAITIANSYNNLGTTHKTLFSHLAISYYKYKEYLRTKDEKNQDFHGSRDFYHLIKKAARNLKHEPNLTRSIAMEALECNFGGLPNSVKIIKEFYFQESGEKGNADDYRVLKCVKSSLKDPESRYILIISKGSLGPYLVNYILNYPDEDEKEGNQIPREYRFYTGSQFENDISEETYTVNMINKIQVCMDSDLVLVLQNMEFESLYDLFNQNFSVINGQKYATIALGSSNSVNSPVHDKFKCIVLIDENDLPKQEAPFLNRFEKHIASFDFLLTKDFLKTAGNIWDVLYKSFTKIDNLKIKPIINLKNSFINLDQEGIEALIYKEQQKQVEQHKMQSRVYLKVIPTFSKELMVYGTQSSLLKQKKALFEGIKKEFLKSKIHNLNHLLTKKQFNKIIVYTFSLNIESIIYTLNGTNKVVGDYNPSNVLEKHIKEFRGEESFLNELDRFYKNDNQKIFLLHFTYQECIHLNNINHVIENFENDLKEVSGEDKSKKKIIIFLIHIDKTLMEANSDNKALNTQNFISHLSDKYLQVTIDNLKGKEKNMLEIIDKSNSEIIKEIDPNAVLEEEIYNIFSLNKYKPLNKIEKVEKDKVVVREDNVMELMVNKFMDKKTKDVKDKIVDFVIKSLGRADVQKPFLQAFLENAREVYDKNITDFQRLFEVYVEKCFYKKFAQTINKLESEGFLSSLIINQNVIHPTILKILDQYLNNLKLETLRAINYNIQSNEVKIILGLNTPKMIYDSLFLNYISQEKDHLVKIDENIRNYYDDETEELTQYQDEKKLLFDNVYQEVSKNLYLTCLEKDGWFDGEQFNLIKRDYYKIFLVNNNILDCDLTSCEDILDYIMELLIKSNTPESNEMEPMKQFSYIVIYTQAYANILKHYCTTFSAFKGFFPELLNNIKQFIQSGEIKLETSARNPEHKMKLNKPFYLVFESLIHEILKIYQEENKLTAEELNDFTIALQQAELSLNNIESTLQLYSKELNNYKAFIIINRILAKLKKNDSATITEILKFEIKENELLKQNEVDEEKLCNCLDGELKQLFSLTSNGEQFGFEIMFLFVTKFKKIEKQKYRLKIMELIFSRNDVIIHLNPLLVLLFSSYSLDLDDRVQEEDEEVEEEEKYDFIPFASDENPYLAQLEQKKDNELLDDVILFYFEMVFKNYFHTNKSGSFLVTGKRRDAFFTAKGVIESYSSKSSEDDQFIHKKLSFLFCVAYIKQYLETLVYCIKNKRDNFNLKEINESLSSNEGPEIISTVQLYLAKIINKCFNTFKEFTQHDFSSWDLKWIDDTFQLHSISCSLFNFAYMNPNSFEDKYQNMTGLLVESLRNSDSSNLSQAILDDTSKLYDFLDVSINTQLSSLKENQGKSNNDYSKLCNVSTNLFDSLSQTIDDKTKSILKLLYDESIFKEKIKTNYFDKLSIDDLELFFYAYKFALLCSRANASSFYGGLISKNIKDVIDNNFIPGGEPKITPKIRGYYKMKKLFETTDRSPKVAGYRWTPGAYFCSCGYYYEIENCSLPKIESTCPICKLTIGGTSHRLADRDGHIRIFQKEEEKKEVLGRLTCRLGNRYEMYNTFTQEIEKEIADEKIGFVDTKYGLFEEEDRVIRSLDQISYRLLSFIFYSAMLFSQLAGFTDEETVKSYCILKNPKKLKPHPAFLVLKDNWKLLNSALQSKGINDIQVFMNLVFPKIIELIEQSNTFPTKESRSNFENTFKTYVTNVISDNYESKKEDYIQKSRNILGISHDSSKSIIEELFPPTEYEDQYPCLKYFMCSTISSEDDFSYILSQKEDNKHLCPILSNYFLHKDEIETLQHIHNLLPLQLDFIKRYSYQISREEGKNKYIFNELENINDPKVTEKFDKFLESFNVLAQKEQLQFACRPPLKPRTITKDEKLAYCLNDNGEHGLGMYCAAMNQRFIEIQNRFITDIVSNITPEHPLIYLKEQLEKKMPLESTTPVDIVTFNLEENSVYKCLYDYVISYSHRDCYENSSINYKQYSQTKIDIQFIEEEFGKIILANKKQFADDQKFVIYKFEAYRDNKSDIILNYSNKYKQKLVGQEQNEIMKKFVEEISQNNDINISDIMFSIQQLIAFFSKQNFSPEMPITEAISKIPKYLKIKDIVTNFFEKNKLFHLDVLIDVYESIEMLCVEEIFEHVEASYKEYLTEEEITRIADTLKLFPYQGISKDNLMHALRKYISRMFGGKRMDMEEPDKELFYFLSREELWPITLRSNPEFDIESILYELQGLFRLTFAKSVEFYNVLTGKEPKREVKKVKKVKKK